MRRSARLVALGAATSLLLVAAGCSGKTATSGTPSIATAPKGMNMAGAQVQVHIPQAAVNARPQPWNLSSPESAVRSYSDWVSYSYRIADSNAATPTMSAELAVKIDSYVQYNLQQKRLLAQQLTSMTFGTPARTATETLLPARETWKYSYLSVDIGNEVIGGPYSASYETTYTLGQKNGEWIVNNVQATPLGTVK